MIKIDEAILIVPRLNMEVVIELYENPFQFKIIHIPKSEYTESQVKNEVKNIITKMLELVTEELK